MNAKPRTSSQQAFAKEASRAVRPLHRVECDGCGWVGYRRNPWGRDCPACGVDRSKLRPVWLAGLAPRRGRCCYLGHIWPAYGHAQHYLGFTANLAVRWPEHLAGGYDPETHQATGRGARLLAAALYAGCTIELVRVWYGEQARALEQRLKQRRQPDSLRAGAARSLKPLCPVCNPDRALRRYPDLPDPPPPPRPRRFVHDPQVWDADREWDLAFPHLASSLPALAQHASAPPNPRTARANPADQGAPTMTNSSPTNKRLPRSLSLYRASDRDATGELIQEQAILGEQEHPMTVGDRALLTQQERDRQAAFARLNPDFGVLPDSRHPDQHRFAQQRERALALGERVTAAEQSEQERGESSHIVSLPRLPAIPPAANERATGRREQTRRRLREGYQRRPTMRAAREDQERDR